MGSSHSSRGVATAHKRAGMRNASEQDRERSVTATTFRLPNPLKPGHLEPTGFAEFDSFVSKISYPGCEKEVADTRAAAMRKYRRGDASYINTLKHFQETAQDMQKAASVLATLRTLIEEGGKSTLTEALEWEADLSDTEALKKVAALVVFVSME